MKMLGLNGLFGLLVAVVLIVGLAIILGITGVRIQQSQSTNYYSLDKNSLQMKSTTNAKSYKLQEK